MARLCYISIINNNGDARLRDVRGQEKRKCIKSHYKHLKASRTHVSKPRLWYTCKDKCEYLLFYPLSWSVCLKRCFVPTKQVFKDLCTWTLWQLAFFGAHTRWKVIHTCKTRMCSQFYTWNSPNMSLIPLKRSYENAFLYLKKICYVVC